MMVRIAYDTEFHERGSSAAIEFISIGMVRDDGAEYYAVSNAVQWWAVYKNEWLRDNVLVQLPGRVRHFGNGGGDFEPDFDSGLYKPRALIAQEVADFAYVNYGQKREDTHLWAYYGAYDHVVLAQLFGRMSDLPDHMPMFTRDLQHVADMFNVDLPEQESGQHNALEDARWVKQGVERVERVTSEHWWIDL